MKTKLLTFLRAAVVIAVSFVGIGAPAAAQTVVSLPSYVNPGTGPIDFGNGPLELKVIQGNAIFTTSQGFGAVSSANSTLIVLTATPTSPPCVNSLIATNTSLNCAIGGGGITSGTLVGSYNASTGTGTGTGPSIGVTNLQPALLSAGMTIGWGAACPTNPTAGAGLQASVGGDTPFYATSRICGYSPANSGPGAAVMPFAIGAH